MSGIIYLVQPAELVGTNRYKIGCSSKNDLSRCKNGYKKGTRYISIMECLEPFSIESQIKRLFEAKFKLIAGKEYFEGNESDMVTEFFNIVKNYKSCPSQVLQTNTHKDSKKKSPNKQLPMAPTQAPNIESVKTDSVRKESVTTESMNTSYYTCAKCFNSYKKIATLKKHILSSHVIVTEPVPEAKVSKPKKAKMGRPKINKCIDCEETFSSKYTLERHIRNNSCKTNKSETGKGDMLQQLTTVLTKLIDDRHIQNSGTLLRGNNNTMLTDNHTENNIIQNTQNNNNNNALYIPFCL